MKNKRNIWPFKILSSTLLTQKMFSNYVKQLYINFKDEEKVLRQGDNKIMTSTIIYNNHVCKINAENIRTIT